MIERLTVDQLIAQQEQRKRQLKLAPKALQTPKKPRTDWKAKYKAERNKVINEAVVMLKDEMRSVPKAWHRGYYSAISKLELMKN